MPGPYRMALLGVAAIGAFAFSTLAPTSAEAARCTRIAVVGGSEYIVNSCNDCRVVNVRRKRRGIAMPVMRTYNVLGRNKFPLSMKGPGRSRITSEVPCKGVAGAGQNIMETKKQTAEQRCVELKQTKTGSVVLINSCATCRGAAIERYNISGQPIGRQAYKIRPQSIIPVDPKGAAGVGYLAEVPCSS